ncbi:MAG: DnaJ domain-containing protein [Methylovirgula sp.]
MPYILAGFLVLWLALYALRAFTRANPAALVHVFSFGAAFATLGLALLLALRGRIDLTVGLGILGLWLLAVAKSKYSHGAGAPKRLEDKPPARPATGPRASGLSRVRSAVIEMELDHATGIISGTILAGPDEGKSLDRLSRLQCETLHRLCLRDDTEGARFLEAYLDRRFPGWRAASDDEPDTRGRGPAMAARLGAMTEDEAYEVLGLRKGATRDDVMRSHRSLIKKLHPDQGGSTDLAARVNEAKDVLMRRHN